jgi:N6-adenosine-specific RNA methylase IME4
MPLFPCGASEGIGNAKVSLPSGVGCGQTDWLENQPRAATDLKQFLAGRRFRTILADPPWQFQNRTGKVAPEHKRLARYGTLSLDQIKELPVADAAADTAHLYLWVPNALLPEGLAVMKAWGFQYKSNIVWQEVRKDGGPDGRGVGFYLRNVTELLCSAFAARTLGRCRQVARK